MGKKTRNKKLLHDELFYLYLVVVQIVLYFFSLFPPNHCTAICCLSF